MKGSKGKGGLIRVCREQLWPKDIRIVSWLDHQEDRNRIVQYIFRTITHQDLLFDQLQIPEADFSLREEMESWFQPVTC